MSSPVRKLPRLALLTALALLAPAHGLPPARALAGEEIPPRAEAVGPIGLTVSDLDRSVEFYTRVLDFEKSGEEAEVAGAERERLQGIFNLRERIQRLRLGEEEIELAEYLAPRGRPFPDGSRGNDRWFQHAAIVVSDLDRAYARLRERRVEHASSGPQRLPDWNEKAGGIRAFYFRDPDGHFLEIISFPEGKGDPRWRREAARTPGKLFLGIDHTAIVVGDSEASLRFYRDRLGLRVAGESENHGVEQEHLNGVFGARLRITALRAERGPGIELLEYLAPRDGRPYPADARANDLLHWETTLRVRGLEDAPTAFRSGSTSWISPGVVEVPDGKQGFQKAFLIRDPDGHALRWIEG